MVIIGPSGSGKTTLLNIFSGIINSYQGEVTLDGSALHMQNDAALRNLRSQRLGFVFQDFKLIEHLKVWDNITLPFRINSKLSSSQDILIRIKALAGDLGLSALLGKYPAKLSHGERQRVAICRALVNQPSLLLADEPTGNLDPINKEHIIDILFEYVNNNNGTLITVTHDHELLQRFDRVIDFKNFIPAA